jgi:RNA polymerase sigma-70 factor (ECF subfamily)
MQTGCAMAESMYARRIVRESDTRPEEAEIAFEQIVREHSRLAYRVAYAVLRNSADAEDAAQESFLKILRSKTTQIEDWAGWIARIAYRTAIDMARRRKHEDVNEFEIADPCEAHDEALSREQQVRRLRRMIAGLPEDLRHPLELSALEELNSRQIAEVLGVNEVTVRTRLMRARQILKEKMEVAVGKKR